MPGCRNLSRQDMSRVFDQTLYSSQTVACKIFEAAIERAQLRHAYLCTGRAIEDKWQLARHLACYLNCQAADKATAGSCLVRYQGQQLPSGACQNCRWIVADAHPQAFIKLQ